MRLGAVDAVALQGPWPDPHAVAQSKQPGIRNGTHIKSQLGANTALWLGQPGAIQPRGATIQAGAVGHVGKARRQLIFHLNLAEQLTAVILNVDGVVNKFTQLDAGARGCFLQQQAAQNIGIQGHVNMHRPGCQTDLKLATVRAFCIGQPPWWQKCRNHHRGEPVADRRCHYQPVSAGFSGREFIPAVDACDHGVGCRCYSVRAKYRCKRIAGHVKERHRGTADG